MKIKRKKKKYHIKHSSLFLKISLKSSSLFHFSLFCFFLFLFHTGIDFLFCLFCYIVFPPVPYLPVSSLSYCIYSILRYLLLFHFSFLSYSVIWCFFCHFLLVSFRPIFPVVFILSFATFIYLVLQVFLIFFNILFLFFGVSSSSILPVSFRPVSPRPVPPSRHLSSLSSHLSLTYPLLQPPFITQ